jgi:hypothetical protein
VASDSESPERAWRTRREAQIERFTKRQRNAGRWLSFISIAEFYSREDRSILPNEDKRAATFDLLARGVLDGMFEENDRSLVLFLHPTISPSRMTREWLKDAICNNWDGDHGKSYLAHCWILWRMFERWRVQNNLPPFPRFEPLDKGNQLQARSQRPKERQKPSFERAQKALKALYPNGSPDQTTVSNKTLSRQVNEKLKNLGLPGVIPSP